jgi:UrcA family protein
MKVKTIGNGRVALMVTGVAVLLGVGASAHASQSMAETPITVSVERPVIKSISDRQNAIKDFQIVARRACKSSGRRDLSAIRSDEKCVGSLMQDYIYKIDKHCGGMKFAENLANKSET